jgi:opacity protein-like surface antigen
VHDSSYNNFPLLANLVFQYPCRCGFTPFAGGGLGPSFSILNADAIVANGSVIDGSDADVVFAYQLFAGLRYRLNERMELGATYKYFVADGADWDADVFLGPDSSIEFDDTQTHIVAFTFDFRF